MQPSRRASLLCDTQFIREERTLLTAQNIPIKLYECVAEDKVGNVA